MFTKEAQELAPKVYEAIKKISKAKWEWKPEAGEFYLDFSILLGAPDLNLVGFNAPIIYWAEHQHDEGEQGELSKEALEGLIPLLHWERIEEILEGMGYVLEVAHDTKIAYYCTVWKEDVCILKVDACKSRQEAVMRAVIELGKRKEND